MPFNPTARFGLAVLLVISALGARGASAAGGAYAVEDADVEVGECGVASWLSFASNSDFIGAVKSSCGFEVVRPIEFEVKYARTRADREWGTSLEPGMKINLLPVEVGKIGVVVAIETEFDLRTGANTGTSVKVPVTFAVSEAFRINLNGGWLYDREDVLHYATYGAGFEWQFIKPVTLIGEVFGLAGQRGDPRSTTEPRAQAGLRFTPTDSMDIDLIYGRNITGENAHWVTLGLNLRFQVLEKAERNGGK